MFIVGFDLGKRKSQICVTDEDGKVLAELRINTKKDDITSAFARFAKARVLIEASTSSQWVTRHLELIGCEVIVGDPRFSLMYAQTNKKIKNDRRDARALADALRLNAYRVAHRRSDAARSVHGQILSRNVLVQARTRLINCVRSLCEIEGVIVAKSHAERFLDRLSEENVDETLFGGIAPLVGAINALNEQIAGCDDALATAAKADPTTRNLQGVRGIGPLTSLTFKAVIDDVTRFESARQVSSYIGLVPGEQNSGDTKRKPGAITKSGNRILRSYLVEAAFNLMQARAPDSPLKQWGLLVASKHGKKKAAVAVARRLSRILFAMWRDDTPYDAGRTAPDEAQAHHQKAAA